MNVHLGQTLEANVGTSKISHEDEPSSMVEPVLSDYHKIIDQIVDSEQVESFLMKELNQMSLKEREQAYKEIHSVGKMIDEPTEFVTERLEGLARELRMIPIKPAYDLAEQISNLYVTFDGRKAAHRWVSFIEGKFQVFGLDVLARSIYLSDLHDDRFDLETSTSTTAQGQDILGLYPLLH
jgi:hypothetical protein